MKRAQVVIGLSFAAGIIAAATYSYWSDNRERLLGTNDDVANTTGQISRRLEEYSKKNGGASPSSEELQTIVQSSAARKHCESGRSLQISSRLAAIDTRQGRHLLAWCTPREYEKWVAVSISDSGKFRSTLLGRSEFSILAQADLGQQP